MTTKERNFIKKKILKCLTEDIGKSQPIFNRKEGWACFNETDLDMVMDKVAMGLTMAMHDLNTPADEPRDSTEPNP